MEETNQQNKIITLGRELITFIKHNLLLVFAFFLGVFFLVVVIISFFFTSQSQQSQTDSISPTSNPFKNSDQNPKITPEESSTKETGYEQTSEDFEKTWEYSPFEESTINDFQYTKNVRPDGAVIYSFPSENPKRPNIMIVKGQVTIVNRTIQFDTTIQDVMDFLGKPDYVAVGSIFWGKNAAMYIYFERGLAYTADITSKKIFEQMEFMPVPPAEFKKAYGEDNVGDLKKY